MSDMGIIAFICLCVSVSKSSKIDDIIAMYEKENTKIEQDMKELVDGYMLFEKDTLTTFKSESSVTLVALYPELKSDTLVQKQLDVYTENNAKIKELKEESIYRSVFRWWLYFGR